jgi:hypothetical protein
MLDTFSPSIVCASAFSVFAMQRPQSQKPKLLDRMREALRSRHYSRRTEQTYCHWVRRFIYHQALSSQQSAEEQK